MSESAVRAYASSKHFSPVALERWLACHTEDRDAFLGVAERLRLGENQVRDLLEQLEDIASRRGSNLAQILASPPVRDVLERRLARNESIHALRQALRRLRYPQLASVEAQLRQLINELELPVGVKVEFPQDLEGEHLTVTLKAASAAELRARVASLVGAIGLEQVDRVYALLEGKW